jgi:predicted DNA-binding protein YlxM (UPF0122 family)
MATKETPQKSFTVNEAAKKLGVTRAAIHQAIKEGRLKFEWGETVHVVEIKKRARLIPAKALANYTVDSSHQARGKKNLI